MHFCCPICASQNWREVVVPRSDGSHYRTDFRECCGCSVKFRRPERFTVGRGLRPSGQNDDDRERSGQNRWGALTLLKPTDR